MSGSEDAIVKHLVFVTTDDRVGQGLVLGEIQAGARLGDYLAASYGDGSDDGMAQQVFASFDDAHEWLVKQERLGVEMKFMMRKVPTGPVNFTQELPSAKDIN